MMLPRPQARRFTALLCATVSLVPLSFAGPIGIRAQAGVRLKGVITGTSRANFIADASVSLYSAGRVLFTKSDGSGHVEFNELCPGACEIQVLLSGFPPGIAENVQGNDTDVGPVSVPIRLVTDSYCLLFSVPYEPKGSDGAVLTSGVQHAPKVHSQLMKPLPKVQVFLLKGGADDKPIASKFSDPGGDFRFARIEPGPYILERSRCCTTGWSTPVANLCSQAHRVVIGVLNGRVLLLCNGAWAKTAECPIVEGTSDDLG